MYPLDELVLNHTMYPQYARFVPLEQKKTALFHLGHDSLTGTSLSKSIGASNTDSKYLA